jgi:excisionase family DNA binding protein
MQNNTQRTAAILPIRNEKLGLTVEEFAKELGIARTSVLNLVNNREVESYKVLRRIYIPREALNAYIDKCHRPRFDASSVRVGSAGRSSKKV